MARARCGTDLSTRSDQADLPPVPDGADTGKPVELLTAEAELDTWRIVEVFSRIVRVDEDDQEFGPVRMAASFSRFVRFGDKQRLIAHFCTGRYARAA